MEIDALKTQLEQMGHPVAVTSFFTEPPLPYIILLPTGEERTGSDSGAEIQNVSYQIELYTVQKDMILERQLEDMLANQGIQFSKAETYIDEDAMYQCAYSIEFYMKVRK